MVSCGSQAAAAAAAAAASAAAAAAAAAAARSWRHRYVNASLDEGGL
jgi:hypothetical protein